MAEPETVSPADEDMEFGDGEESPVSPAPKEPLPPLRVFFAGVDTYFGRVASRKMSGAMYAVPNAQSEDVSQSGEHSDGDEESMPRRVEIVGTLMEEGSSRPPWVKSIVESTTEAILEAIETCDIIVYDILLDVDQAAAIVDELPANASGWKSPKLFICLSTLMTWTKTPKDEDDEDEGAPLTEDSYKRRKPHPNFKAHIAVEKAIIKHASKLKKQLSAYVIARGLVYGNGERIFHYLFKTAWLLNKDYLPVVGGPNVVSTIDVNDLASVVSAVVAERPPQKYIIAADESQNTMMEIVEAIARTLGNGQAKRIHANEAVLISDYSQSDIDMLRADLRVEAITVNELDFEWVHAGGMVADINAVVNEYRTSRGLTPLRVIVQGPPASGKTHIASQIAKEYKIHHILVEDVIKEYTEYAQKNPDRALRSELKAELAEGFVDGRYTDAMLIIMYRWKLHTPACQNQGFILDGFPKSFEQAEDLFMKMEDFEEEADEDPGNGTDSSILPEFVILIEGSFEFLSERIVNLPEEHIVGTHNTEEHLKRRYDTYMITNQERAVWDYFDQLEILPLTLQATEEDDKVVMGQVRKYIGKAHNYGPTKEELAAKRREKKAQEAKALAAQQRREEELARLDEEGRAKAEAEWRRRLTDLEVQEQQALATQAMPLRDYLMENVMPTLTAALIEVCQVRPEDPIDFLAEYLFARNPAEDQETTTT